MKTFIGLDLCPYCKSNDITLHDYRIEYDDDIPEGKPDLFVCVDWKCKCGGFWTVDCRPKEYYIYASFAGKGEEEFIDDPKQFEVGEEQDVLTLRYADGLGLTTYRGDDITTINEHMQRNP